MSTSRPNHPRITRLGHHLAQTTFTSSFACLVAHDARLGVREVRPRAARGMPHDLILKVKHGRPGGGEIRIGAAGVVRLALHAEEMEGPRSKADEN